MANFTFKDLNLMGRSIPVPLRLLVEADSAGTGQNGVSSKEIVIEKLFRVIPGRRIVGLCEYKGRQAVAKIFFHPRYWKRHLKREMRGNGLLADAGQSIPRSVETLRSAKHNGGILLTEFLVGSVTLEDSRSDILTGETDFNLVTSAVASIASCHNRGLWQNDIHLGNFLFFQNNIFLLDGGAIKFEKIDSPLSQTRSLENLAVFFAQFPVWHDRNIDQLLSEYLMLRDGKGWATDEGSFFKMVRHARTKRLDIYARKLFRPTSAHAFSHSMSRLLVYDRVVASANFDAFIVNPDSYLEKGKLIKDGNSSTVASIAIDGKNYILKRYNIKSFQHGIKRLFTPSRAYKSWRAGLILEMLGIGTAHPIMCLEQRVFWFFRRRAYFLSEEVSGDHLIADYENETKTTEQWEVVFSAFRNLFSVMKEYKISHGDMKATNFIFSNRQLYILDLDSLKQHKSDGSFAEKFDKDLDRFRKNWLATNLEKQAAGAMADFMSKQG
jgi:tRNA A-37 threonylcarbamoyl transferase component Bud32